MANVEREFTPAEMRAWSVDTYSRMAKWARANHLKPQDISLAHPLSVEFLDCQYVIRYHRITRDEHGNASFDKATDLVNTTVQLVPLEVPLP